MTKKTLIIVATLALLLVPQTGQAARQRLPKGTTVWGQVLVDGTPRANVVVSDGADVTLTDKKGFYYLKSAKREGSVFVSIPSGTEVETTWGMPHFWQRLNASEAGAERHDFVLRAVDNSNYTVLAISDVHLANLFDDMYQFKEVFMPRFMEEYEKASANGPVYCLNCGDSVYDRYWYEYGYSIECFPATLEDVRFPVPMFHVMGNHDNDGGVPREGDIDFNAAERYRRTMGPTHYSFNLGREHYVVMDNIVYLNSEGRIDTYEGITGKRDHEHYFTREQLDWLVKDLATVKDKDAPLVIAFHSPILRHKGGLTDKKIEGRFLREGYDPDEMLNEFTALLKDFREVHFISGHSHQNMLCYGADDTSRYPYIGNITEHNISGVCGCWWQPAAHGGLTLAPDGGPAGFEVFPVKGDKMEWYFVSTDDGAGQQFRVFDMNAVRDYYRSDGALQAMLRHYDKRNDYGKIEDNWLLINVWAWESKWKISVTENGVDLPVEHRKSENPQFTLDYYLPKAGWDDNSKNRWPAKYNEAGVKPHYFWAKASSPTSTVVVKVTDSFGNEYVQTVERPKAFGKKMR
ncbi:MAG: calcineurin-like phosphoesterase C-terminal domain-containing protein [Bacteroidales bacterium]|nr:calcineurin-like phosphoesterase C-terminal domain-containing protein [Bacteroidales bacterium]